MSIESRSRQFGKVFDHWQIREFLGSGSGGKSAVFRLVHADSGSVKSALKVISLIEKRGNFESLSESRKAQYESVKQKCKDCAEQEVLLMNDLQGRTNVVDYLDHTFVDWADEDGYGCDMLIRMELLKDLRGKIEGEYAFDQEEILNIGKEICTALVLCHGKNILHRDIKPENIFYNEDGNYKLGDFGVSRILSAAPMSKASTGVCTPEYAAPEQMHGMYDKRVDIYSLGLVLYELSNDNLLPFAASSYVTEREVQERLSGKPLPAPCNVGKDLAAVILKACAFHPDDRYQTAEAFLEALNALSCAGPQPVRKPSFVGRGPQKAAPSVGGNATQYAAPDATRKAGSATQYAAPATARKVGNATQYAAPATMWKEGGAQTVYAAPRTTTARKNKPTIPRAAILGAALLLVLGIAIAALWGIGSDSEQEAITQILDDASALADSEHYDEAISKVQEGLESYPDSDALKAKQKELSELQRDSDVSGIISEAQALASGSDYDGAIAKLQSGLEQYPDSQALQDELVRCQHAQAEQETPCEHIWLPADSTTPKTCQICAATEGTPLSDPLAQLSVGDIFTYGVYEQDNSFATGSEGIEWIVLDKQSDKLLAISRYALDSQRYHQWGQAVTWADCSVRTWLNSTFYNTAFDEEEKGRVLDTTDSGTGATDKVFLLSIDELNEYFHSSMERACRATNYAISQNAYVNPSTGGSWWLLRTPGISNRYVMSINSDGSIDYAGGRVESDRGTVRPAMWIEFKK